MPVARLLTCVVAILAVQAATDAHPARRVLYHGLDYGSEAAFDPATYWINAAFDSTQVKVWGIPPLRMSEGTARVFDRLGSVERNVLAEGGWGRFFRTEFASSNAVPNYTMHLIGNGGNARMLMEWLLAHGYGELESRVLAVALVYSTCIANEAVESQTVPATDNYGDLLFFDLASLLLWSIDPVAEFAQKALGVGFWHYQPMPDVRYSRPRNAGLNLVMRPEWFGDRVTLFVYLGMTFLGGFSVKIDASNRLSFGVGMASVDPGEARVFRASAGVFWDRNGSLLASLQLFSTDDLNLRVNLYPGLLKVAGMRPAVWFGLTGEWMPILGVVLH